MATKIKVALAATSCVAVLAVVFAPSFTRARAISQCNACNNYQLQIANAKEQWRINHNKSTNDVPTWADLAGTNGYLSKELVCPAGGVYTLARLDESRDVRFRPTDYRNEAERAARSGCPDSAPVCNWTPLAGHH
jgi:hypothetical protein